MLSELKSHMLLKYLLRPSLIFPSRVHRSVVAFAANTLVAVSVLCQPFGANRRTTLDAGPAEGLARATEKPRTIPITVQRPKALGAAQFQEQFLELKKLVSDGD